MQVPGRIGVVQVGIVVQHRLDGVRPRPELIEAVEREQGRAAVEGRDGARLEAVHVAGEDRGGIHPGLADGQPGLARPAGRQHHQQPPSPWPGRRPLMAGDGSGAEPDFESQRLAPAWYWLVGMD
jgi:hypothetical protein